MNGASIEVQFIPRDEGARELLEAIGQFPQYSVERFEMEAFLFMTLMRVSQRSADRVRELNRRTAVRKNRKRDPAP